MLGVFGILKDFVLTRKIENDCIVFRIHYQFTTVILMLFILAITATEFIGSPIMCMNKANKVERAVTSYCWITGTYTMADAGIRSALQSPHQGIGLSGGPWNDAEVGREVRYHAYYQWVVFVLSLMALLCYSPKFVWDIFENKMISSLLMGLNKPSLVASFEDEGVAKKRHSLVQYLQRHFRMHDSYFAKYFLCEIMSLVNIIVQMYLMDSFFGGEFFSYGTKVLSMSDEDQEDRIDPMIYVFPRMTKCVFQSFGSSGGIQSHDALCVLALNIINEKAFIFIWFWYIFLSCILSACVLYRLLLIALPGLRPRLIHAKNRMVPVDAVHAICRRGSIGDWWLLYLLSSNIDPFVYRDCILELSKQMEAVDNNSGDSSVSSKTSMV